MEPFIAQILLFGGTFAPRGWAYCDGQLLAIAQYNALFSILGTTYGGDGRTTFGLPDLRGRVPVHAGSSVGPGLAPVRLGEKGGALENKLSVAQLPAHNHPGAVQAANPVGRGEGTTSPNNAYPAEGGNYATAKNVSMAADSVTVGPTGSNQAINNMQPFLGLNYIIALQGTYPSRS